MSDRRCFSTLAIAQPLPPKLKKIGTKNGLKKNWYE